MGAVKDVNVKVTGFSAISGYCVGDGKQMVSIRIYLQKEDKNHITSIVSIPVEQGYMPLETFVLSLRKMADYIEKQGEILHD